MRQSFTQSSPFSPATPRILPALAFRLEAVFWVSLMATAILGLYWFATHQGGPSNNYLSMLVPQVEDERLFANGGELTREQARRRYAESLQALRDKNYDVASSGFESLESAYPGLLDLILMHEAQANAGLGNEWAAQQKLEALPRKKPDSPLKAMAQYELALSHVRANEPDKALNALDTIRAEHPDSPYAIGSLYYLGVLSQKDDPATTRRHWLDYLSQCPDCRFSGEIASQLPAAGKPLSAQEHLLIGVGLASNQRDWDLAYEHLKLAPIDQAWLWLAKVQLHRADAGTGSRLDAVKTLYNGLVYAKDTEQAQTAVDQILKNADVDAKTALTRLSQQRMAFGQDYVQWRLAQIENSPTRFGQLLSQFPQSDYAPESSWMVMWSDYKAGRKEAFLQRAQNHLKLYPYSRSAPRALFWVAKSQESGQPAESKATYQKLIKTYPSDYYAFRAESRLNALNGKGDAGWKTNPARAYPPKRNDWATLDIYPATLAPSLRRDALKELQQIAAADDVLLLFNELEAQKKEPADPPATVISWAHHVKGERAQGIRSMREAFEARQRADYDKQTFTGAPLNKTERTLMYPVYFGAEIAPNSKKTGLDPFLIQSLMREESYFNEFAVSSSDARGLMQLLPATAAEVAGWEKLNGYQTLDLFRPEVNTRLGSRYLAHLHQLFNGNSMPSVGAYNGGPNAMKRWVNASSSFNSDPDRFVEDIPYAQSRDYIKKVFGAFWNYNRLYGS